MSCFESCPPCAGCEELRARVAELEEQLRNTRQQLDEEIREQQRAARDGYAEGYWKAREDEGG